MLKNKTKIITIFLILILLFSTVSVLADDEVNEMLKEIIASGNYTAADMGKIMKEIMPKVSGKFDRSKINPMVKALL